MRDRKAARLEFGEQRLDVAKHGLAGGRIAHMADRQSPREAVDGRGVGEVVADQPLPALRMKPHAVVSDDAGGFLATMLQSMQAKRGNGGGVGMVKNAEDAAFLAQSVAVGVEVGFVGRI